MTATLTESTRNGLDTATLLATLDAVKAAPVAAKFHSRAPSAGCDVIANQVPVTVEIDAA